MAYGGASNPAFRQYVIEASSSDLSNIAGEIKANLQKYHFAGVDLDIEDWWSHNKAENSLFAQHLAEMVVDLKKSLDADNDPGVITVTVGPSAADPTAAAR